MGVVLGMLAQGMLMRGRDQRVAEIRTEPGCVSLVEEVIQPRAEQASAVHAVLEASASSYDSVVTASRDDVRMVLDSMKARLAPLLDDAQRERLSRMANVPDPNRRPPRPGEPPSRQGRPRDDRPPQGPPGDDRPPRRDNPPPPDSGAPRRDAPPPRPR
ncbi:MAG: hypothetical protein FIA95_08635 [Gemmatimonadetes bacterium]|nr:hypothetical protein [Gemmatimonadota bacterium]